MKLIIGALLAGGTFVASDLPNPQVGECEIADVVVARTEPTMIDTDGAVAGLRIWQVCSFQVPTGVGSNMRAVDETFWTDIDLDGIDPDAAETAADVLEHEGYLP